MGIPQSKDEQDDDQNKGCIVCSPPIIPFWKRNDPIGSPCPDTPLYHKRKREQVLKTAVEKHRNDPIFSSKYDGLEKEPLDLDIAVINDNKKNANGRVGDRKDFYRLASAEVHEGEHAERAMHSKYELLEVLGVGSTSTCHRCVHRETKTHFACKIIDKRLVEDRFQGLMDQFQVEVEALRSLNHPNIIRLYDVYITPNQIYIVMELMEGGELFDYVVQKGTLTEEEASRIVRKVTSAVVYMHSKNICHRDLKPENLLLRQKPSAHEPLRDEIEVKIIDFGLSKCMEEPVARSFLGTRGYLAPEMLQRQDYTRAVDTWALGVIVFVLLCGCLPFDDDSKAVPSDETVVRAKFTLRFPRWAKNLSTSAKDLLQHLLDVNPATRYTAEQALQHPWVRGETAPPGNLLASPARIRKSPRLTPPSGLNGTRPAVAAATKAAARPYKHGAAVNSVTPPRNLVRKTSI